MNQKDKKKNHKFQPETQSKLKRPTSLADNRPAGEYMKPTVN
jgi:hypothetical protein